MHYTASRENNTSIKIANDRGEVAGTLMYTSWLPIRMKIKIKTINNYVYDIKAGFGLAKKYIAKDGMPYATITPNWGMGLKISFENGGVYLFRRKGIFTSAYILRRHTDETEIASVSQHFVWRLLSIIYEIDVDERMIDKEMSILLPFLMVYCAQYMRRRRAPR